MVDPKTFLVKLHKSLNTLREREAKYAGNAPPELLSQIDDHKQAIWLTEQVIDGELSQIKWQGALEPLLIAIESRSGQAASSMTIGDIEGGIYNSVIAGGDVNFLNSTTSNNFVGASSKDQIRKIIESARGKNQSPDLNGANLMKANLVKMDLRGVELIGADLRGARLIGADLSDANLDKANLSGADLREAILDKANLHQANLTKAQLSGASLIETNLSEAVLKGANLTKANLERAHVSGANLERADLGAANLKGANLSRTDLSYVDLDEVDLTEAINVDEVIFPSGPTMGEVHSSVLYGPPGPRELGLPEPKEPWKE